MTLDLDKISERLDAYASFGHPAIVEDARAMVAVIRAMQKALEPFAKFIGADRGKLPDHMPLTQGSPLARNQVMVADFRRASQAFHMVALHNDSLGREER